MAHYNVANIPLTQVLTTYFGYQSDDFEKQGAHVHLTKCPLHGEQKGASLSLYDKTKDGKGWDWFCFGACHKGGSAANLLVESGKFSGIQEAVQDLRKTFHLEFPETVRVADFSVIKGFTPEFLVERGIVDHDHIKDGEIIPGIVVPYLDREGNVVALKKRLKYEGSGKYTFLEGKNTIYGLDRIDSYAGDVLYICEGETDALTMMQAGFPAIGVPGASAWKEEWTELLGRFAKLVCLSDNDKAGIELRKQLAEDFPEKLYIASLPRRYNDVNDFFVYGCSANVSALHTHFNTNIALPATYSTFLKEYSDNESLLHNAEAWRALRETMGPEKVQFELFLGKLRKVRDGMSKAITAAVKSYCMAPTPVTKEGDEQEEESSRIFVKGGRYVKVVQTLAGPMEEVLSNFTMHLVHTVEADGSYLRICKLVNTKGVTSRLLRFDSDTLTKPVEFMSLCKSAGNFIFRGDFQDLIALNEILLQDEASIIQAPDHIGRIGDIWLMGRYGIDSKGEIQEADENQIITLDDQRYMVRSLNIVDDTDETFFPALPDTTPITDEYLRDVAITIRDNIGGYEAWMALGFGVAGWHSNEIYRHNNDKSFPILFINGKRNSGKTYLARWLMSFYGFQNMDGRNFAMPSIVSMIRKLGYYSSLPQWYDDYRNEIKDIKFRNEFMLGVYNRQGADKGTKAGFGVRSETVRGLLLLSGEDTPNDNAVLSRCCTLQVSAYHRDDALLPHMLDLVNHFPELGYHVLRTKQETGSGALLRRIDAIQQDLLARGIDGRLARNSAVFAAGFLSLFGPVLTEEETAEFLTWLRGNAEVKKQVIEEDHTVAQFLGAIPILATSGKLEQGVHFQVSKGKLYLWLKAIYVIWDKEIGATVSPSVLSDYLENEKYFIKKGWPYKMRADGTNVKTVVLSYLDLPEGDLRSLCHGADATFSEF